MQATVASFDAESRAGEVVTDGGRMLGFAAAALADHIRHLRPGQRVHLTLEGEEIVAVQLWT